MSWLVILYVPLPSQPQLVLIFRLCGMHKIRAIVPVCLSRCCTKMAEHIDVPFGVETRGPKACHSRWRRWGTEPHTESGTAGDSMQPSPNYFGHLYNDSLVILHFILFCVFLRNYQCSWCIGRIISRITIACLVQYKTRHFFATQFGGIVTHSVEHQICGQ